jgi:hypothetical protein
MRVTTLWYRHHSAQREREHRRPRLCSGKLTIADARSEVTHVAVDLVAPHQWVNSQRRAAEQRHASGTANVTRDRGPVLDATSHDTPPSHLPGVYTGDIASEAADR